MPVPASVFAVDSSSGNVGRTASSILAPVSRRAPTSATSATQARVAATPRYIFRLTTISGGRSVIWSGSRSSGERPGEDAPDVLAVARAHPKTVAAVVLAEEGAREAQVEGLTDRRPVVDEALVHRHGEGHDRAGCRVLVTQVVLDVPVVGVGEHLVEHRLDGLDGSVQADEVPEVRVEAARLVVNFLQECDRAVARADVRVLVHLEGDLLTVLLCVLCELTDQGRGLCPDLRVVGVLVAVCEPEPQRLLLRWGEVLEETEADHLHAEIGGDVQESVTVGEVLDTALGVQDAAAGGGDRGDRQADVGEHVFELGEPSCLEVGDAHPRVGGVDLGEAQAPRLAQVPGPLLGRGVLDGADRASLFPKASIAQAIGQFSAVYVMSTSFNVV